MTIRCELCGTVAPLKKQDGEHLCPDCIQCETDPAHTAPEHRPVDGGFECKCGAERQTPLGITRHRSNCEVYDAE